MSARMRQEIRPESHVKALRLAEWNTTSETARCTETLGAALGALLAGGDVICLSGELGAGKTVFSRGIGIGWGATLPLTSPTYNLVHEHERRADSSRLYHLDFYRISGAGDAETLGIYELLDEGEILVCEWPERVLDILPAQRLWIEILLRQDDGRDLLFTARGERHRALLDDLRAALGCKRRGIHAAGD